MSMCDLKIYQYTGINLDEILALNCFDLFMRDGTLYFHSLDADIKICPGDKLLQDKFGKIFIITD